MQAVRYFVIFESKHVSINLGLAMTEIVASYFDMDLHYNSKKCYMMVTVEFNLFF